MTAAKTVTEALETRISVRDFLPTPVPAEVIRRVLATASRSPSGGNVQPWNIDVVAGAKLDELKAIMQRRLAEGVNEEGAEVGGDGHEGDDVLSVTGVMNGEKKGRGELLHHVASTDTLAGLSLRYGISTQRIREVNSIMGSSIVQAQIRKVCSIVAFHSVYAAH